MPPQRTAPTGYPSNFSAILDLIRFGFGIWRPPTMAVLLFHVERSTAWGWASDQHAQSQALKGIYSNQARRWTRGPAGVANGTLNRENNALLAAGILTRIRRSTAKGGHAASEYAPNWLAIRATIAQWKDSQEIPHRRPLFEAPPFSQAGRSPSPTAGDPFSQAGRSPSPTAGDTVVSSESLPEDVSESSTHAPTSANEVAEFLAGTIGRPLHANDQVPGKLLAIAGRIFGDAIAVHALCRWVQEFAADKRAQNYQITSPGLFLKAAGDMIPWARANARLIESIESDERSAKFRAIREAQEARETITALRKESESHAEPNQGHGSNPKAADRTGTHR